MDMDLNGRRVFITGASSGIGLGTARVFAGAGASVALCARSADKLNALAEEINQGGGRAVACPADVTDTAALADALDRALDALGGIDAVVHCAGTNIKGTADEVDEDGWDRIIDANLKSAYRLARLTHPMLKASAQESGRAAKFLVIGSVGTRLGIPQSGAYCASKGGLVQLVKVLSAEWARDNICVNLNGVDGRTACFCGSRIVDRIAIIIDIKVGNDNHCLIVGRIAPAGPVKQACRRADSDSHGCPCIFNATECKPRNSVRTIDPAHRCSLIKCNDTDLRVLGKILHQRLNGRIQCCLFSDN